MFLQNTKVSRGTRREAVPVFWDIRASTPQPQVCEFAEGTKNRSYPRKQLSALVLQAARHHPLIPPHVQPLWGIRASCRVQIQPPLLQVYQTVRAPTCPKILFKQITIVSLCCRKRARLPCTHASPGKKPMLGPEWLPLLPQPHVP